MYSLSELEGWRELLFTLCQRCQTLPLLTPIFLVRQPLGCREAILLHCSHLCHVPSLQNSHAVQHVVLSFIPGRDSFLRPLHCVKTPSAPVTRCCHHTALTVKIKDILAAFKARPDATQMIVLLWGEMLEQIASENSFGDSWWRTCSLEYLQHLHKRQSVICLKCDTTGQQSRKDGTCIRHH